MTEPNVLIVEDDTMIGLLLAEILEDLGYDVCAIAATEEEAIAAAVSCKPGLMIVDEHLRAGTGTSAVERILLNGAVPCVFISGAPVHRDKQSQTVLRKPFLIQDLVRAIQNAAGNGHTPLATIPIKDAAMDI